MQLPGFEKAYLLEAIGWAIVHSFWQTGLLWLLYQAIVTIDKKLSALIKYNLAILLLFTSLLWFSFTIIQKYRLLLNLTDYKELIAIQPLVFKLIGFNYLFPFLAVIYLVLLCLHTMPFVKNLYATIFLQNQGIIKAPVELRLFTSQTSLHLGINKKVRVWMSAQVDVPSVVGFIKPVILLPLAILSQLSVKQTEAILLHELAHIKRNDYLLNLLQALVELILFFNPFVILISKAVKKERENCCDDWVLNFRYERYDYAKALLILEEHRHSNQCRLVLAATNDRKKLLRRIKRLFNIQPKTNFNLYQQLKLASLAVLLMVAMINFFPVISSKPVLNILTVNKQREKEVVANIVETREENSLRISFKSTLPGLLNTKTNKRRMGKSKKKTGTAPDAAYINAFINEDLLNDSPPSEPVISQVVEKEISFSKKIIVIIEDQQSGKKPINTYYFELNNNNGSTIIKPLLMLNKYKAAATFKLSEKLTISDTLHLPVNKKKITS